MKTTSITMKTLAAGPDGALRPGQTYRVPEQVSREQADELVAGGYAVPGNDETRPAPASSPEPADKPLEKLTVDQLKDLADTEDIDLGPATKRADLITVITDERAKRARAAAEPGGS